jgi:uncharacterized membrane protein (DUF373 family)
MKRPTPPPTIPSPLPFVRRATASLVWAERIVFFAIGLLLFLAAVALLKTSVGVLFYMFAGGPDSPIAYASAFLDAVLLVLMIVELAYTVILSLRGSVLQAEPFLIVGLIAVIRRILVITVGEPGQHGSVPNFMELAILTGVVIVFVGAIVLLRMRPREDPPLDDERGR